MAWVKQIGNSTVQKLCIRQYLHNTDYETLISSVRFIAHVPPKALSNYLLLNDI
jgi:hypothetical protein